jgi:hypothetical protein
MADCPRSYLEITIVPTNFYHIKYDMNSLSLVFNGSSINSAPKPLLFAFDEGHPQFKLISEYPKPLKNRGSKKNK